MQFSPRAISPRPSWIAFPYTRHIAFITLRLPFADAQITLCGAAMIQNHFAHLSVSL
jgi:hypothetical protein